MASVDEHAQGQSEVNDLASSRSSRKTSTVISHNFPPNGITNSPSPPPYSPGGLALYDDTPKQPTSTMSPPETTLSRLLRRAPFISHVMLLIFIIFGPEYFPRLLVACLFFTSVLFFAQQVCALQGAYDAMVGIKACARTDWKAWATKEKAVIRASMSDSELEEGLLANSEENCEFEDVEHLIIVPNYKEGLHTLTETLTVLASHRNARVSYRVCLGMEVRERGSEAKARTLLAMFQDSFLHITYTMHPSDIPGEAAGKSSNLAWASREMARRYSRGEAGVNGIPGLNNMIITVIDSDTCLASDWFAACAAKFCVAPLEQRRAQMFCLPIVFDRNANDVPAPVRITDIFWSLAGMSSTYKSSSVKIPTSAYAISMMLCMHVGFWDAGAESIGEDMHMYLKCFFGTGGHIFSETIYSPASQTDVVSGNRGGLAGFIRDGYARYEQALRHMFGALDSGYALNRLLTWDFKPAPDASSFLFENTTTTNEVTAPVPSSSSPPSMLLEADPPALFPIEEEDGTLSESTPSLLGLDSESTVSSVGPDTPAESVMGPSNPSYFNAFPPSKMSVPMMPMHGPLSRVTWSIGRSGQGARSGHSSGLSWSKAKRLLTPSRSDLNVADDANKRVNLFRLANVFVKLYQAHFMLIHLFVITIFAELFVLRPQFNPVLATFNIATDPSVTSSVQARIAVAWTLRDFIAFCALIRGLSVPLTLLAFFFYDRFHNYAAVGRWKDPAVFDSRYGAPNGPGVCRLGQRASEVSPRKFPFSCLDWLCIPVAIVYGVFPLIHAQFIHVFTDTLAYKTSAKPVAKVTATTDPRRS